MSENKPLITSITLGGFQVFDSPTTIPLGHLTLLFGPNSAGKSAVEDGLVLLGQLLDREGHSPSSEVIKHWRRTGNHEHPYVPSCGLGLTASIHTDIRGVLFGHLGQAEKPRPRKSLAQKEVSVSVLYELIEGETEYRFPQSTVSFSLSNVGLLHLVRESRFGVNLGHPVFKGAKLNFDYAALSRTMPQWISIENGWVYFNSPNCFISRNFRVDPELFFFCFSDRLEDDNAADAAEATLGPALNELTMIFNVLADTIVGNMNIRTDIVHASRTVPSDAELRHLITSHLLEEHDCSDLSRDFGLREEEGKFYGLAKSFLSLEFPKNPQNRYYSQLGHEGKGERLATSVNRALADHLFMERGYRLEAKFLMLMQPDQFAALVVPEEKDIGDYPLIVRIRLVDSTGRRFSFDEVGSGLGYVLPVLCSAYDESSISLIQQPELHLHPALQAALGDVFIEAMREEKQLIVETHSEHLLLRVLKRIRQTSSTRRPPRELRLKPEDVSVVYFDPKTDGTTHVKPLRISPDGDFLDMWPRGFFPERDRELFDE